MKNKIILRMTVNEVNKAKTIKIHENTFDAVDFSEDAYKIPDTAVALRGKTYA